MLDFGWMADHLDELLFRTIQHIWLAAIAVGIGFLISFALLPNSSRPPSVRRRMASARSGS